MSQIETQEQTFQKIVALCDITEKMLLEIQSPGVENQKELVEIVTPVTHAVDNAVKVVTETFIEHIKDDEKPDKQRSHKVDMAMKGIYDALRTMKEKGEKLAQVLNKEVMNG